MNLLIVLFKASFSSYMIYVDCNFVIRKEFLGFFYCDLEFLGKASVELVLGELINLRLEIINCGDQTYYGAAAISGHINGLSKNSCKLLKLTIKQYILIAIVTATCNIQCISNVFNQI